MTSHASTEKALRARSTSDGKYLTVALGGEEYGVPVGAVREIVGLLPITRVPNTPGHVAGVINLRGKVVPAVDLRQKLGLSPIEPTQRTCIVVLQPHGEGLIGLLVDSVIEVLTISADDIDASPGVTVAEHGVAGVAKIKGQVKVLLDVAAVLRDELEAQMNQSR